MAKRLIGTDTDNYNLPTEVRAALWAKRFGGDSVSVLDTGDPLTDAIADGTTHPLSERFATLESAQAVFPRATALTEEIDRHAIQWAMDHYSHVIIPDGTGDYIIDAGLFTSGADTDRGLGYQTIVMPGRRFLKLRDGATPFFFFQSGNARTVVNRASPTTDECPPCPNLTLDIRIDGNKDGAGSALDRDGFALYNCPNLDLSVEVKNCTGWGGVVRGVITGTRPANIMLRKVWTHHNAYRGFGVQLRCRKVTYLDVKAWENGGNGVYIDHSECRTVSVMAWENGGDGIEVHNVYADNIVGLTALKNGGHGIVIGGAPHSTGSNWLSFDNGQDYAEVGGDYHDVYFSNLDEGWGLTREARFTNIVCGPMELTAAVDYPLYVDDDVTTNVEIEAKIVESGTAGTVRVPDTRGELAVRASLPAKALPTWICGGDEHVVVKEDDQTVNNSSTLQDDADFVLHVAPEQTWEIEYTLFVHSAGGTTPDFKAALSAPSGATSRLYRVVAALEAATGGTGPSAYGIAAEQVIGTFSGLEGFAYILRAVVVNDETEGDVTLQWAQNTADASDTTLKAGSVMRARRLA